MTQFIKYLNESSTLISDIEEFNDILTKQCKPYLKLIKPFNEPFKRGMRENNMGIKNVRKNRRPKGTDYDTFIDLNDWLDDNRHNRRDQSVMAINDDASLFGREYFIFPVDPLSYTWMDSKDMNMDDNRTGWDLEAPTFYIFGEDRFPRNKTGEDLERQLKKPFKDYFHTDKGISTAYKKKYEIWFDSSRYFYAWIEKYGWNKNTQMLEKY